MNKAISTNPEPLSKRPFFLSVLNIVILTYSGALTLITLILSINYKWVTKVLNDYLPNQNYDEIKVLLMSVTALLIFGFTFWSGLLIWKLKYKGFIIYFGLTIITIFVLLFSGYGYMPEYIALIGIMLLMFFYSVKIRKMINSSKMKQAKVENSE